MCQAKHALELLGSSCYVVSYTVDTNEKLLGGTVLYGDCVYR
jgi:hypothetical protein